MGRLGQVDTTWFFSRDLVVPVFIMLSRIAVLSSVAVVASQDPCAEAAYKPGCKCFATQCDLPGCLGDPDKQCPVAFGCAIKCGNATYQDLDCTKKCVHDHDSKAGDDALKCYLGHCVAPPDPCADAAYKPGCKCFATQCDLPACLGDPDAMPSGIRLCHKVRQCHVPRL